LEGIVNFKKEKFIRDCRDFLKTGVISDDLRTIVYNSTAAELEKLKENEDQNTIRIIEYVIQNVSKITSDDIARFKQKTNILCKNVLDTLETSNDKYMIKEVMNRYRDSINPVKAVYYDLQEIIFLYNDKPKTKHHQFLIDYFRDISKIEPYLLAIDKDLTRLHECKNDIEKLKYDYKINLNSIYATKIKELSAEMKLWRKLLVKFPEWVEKNHEEKSKYETWWDKFIYKIKDFLGMIE
jgi:hypothetical protein